MIGEGTRNSVNETSTAAVVVERTNRLRAEDVTIGYDKRVISEHLDVEIPDGAQASLRTLDEVTGKIRPLPVGTAVRLRISRDGTPRTVTWPGSVTWLRGAPTLTSTNGKRDRCCAELGRPIAGLLSQEWPDGTWETTHLGGHRFSGTLLALPSGLTLGRLDTSNVLAACEAIERGEVPVELVRGRAGRPGVDQVRELHVLVGGDPADDVVATPGPPRRHR